MSEQSTIKSKTSATGKPSKLAKVGVVLAVLVPPVGLLLSIIVLARSKGGRNVQPASIGIGIGIVLSILGILFLPFFDMFFQFFPNNAQIKMEPLIHAVEARGGTKLCDEGFNGNGIDYKEPYYRVYYRIKDSGDLSQGIKDSAGQIGFLLKPNELSSTDSFEASELERSEGKSEFLKSLYTVHDEETSRALYVDSLEVSIIRKGPVDVRCDIQQSVSAKPGEVILRMMTQMPDEHRFKFLGY